MDGHFMKLSYLFLTSATILLVACESSPAKKEPAASAAPVPLPESALPAAQAPPPASTTDASGVTTTPSGLRYRVLASGPADGRSPSYFDSVMVHYRGTLTNGTVFDSSYERGSPATFGVGQVIPGWTEALKLMKPGDKWMLHIPSRLAYGGRAVGDKIPPNSDLIFQVELLQVFSGL
jgi:FKBP-type peptidyl-prolyl cis-trans isomerase FklB